MHRILFVDDEPKILTGLRRMLRSMRHEWEMEFAEGGFAALDLLRTRPFDVVVSDARMPGIEGTELLQKVRCEYPAIVRMILSGQCSRSSVLRCVGVAHQFLSKPCDSEILKEAIRQVCRLSDSLGNQSDRAAVSRVDSLPSAAAAYEAIVEQLAADLQPLRSVAETIASDIAMSARVLQLVSSGFFGTPQRMIEVERATELLGLDTLRALVSTTTAIRPPAQGEISEECLQDLTRHSSAVAAAARRIAESMTGDRHVIVQSQVAGMLHEVGTLVQCTGDRPEARLDEPAGVSAPRSCSVRAGGYLAALWGVPAAIAEVIGNHRSPGLGNTEGFNALTAVHVADACVATGRRLAADDAGEVDTDYLESIGCADRLGQWREICHATCLGEVLQ
jgi:HD-like signal output (HDOD) protein